MHPIVKNGVHVPEWLKKKKSLRVKKNQFWFHVDLKFVSSGLCFVHLLQTHSISHKFSDTEVLAQASFSKMSENNNTIHS